jgi:type III pantothenate kinase
MLLAIDIGNSTIGIGLFLNPEKNTKLFIKKIPTHPAQPAEAYKKIIADFINSKSNSLLVTINSLLKIDSIISSVVPSLNTSIIDAVKDICGKKPLVLNHKSNSGITFAVSKPSEVGADRIANAVAGLHCTDIWADGKPQIFRSKKAVAVVDFGTATTITVCAPKNLRLSGDPFADEKHKFIGGAIMPGIELMLKSLYSGTSKLPLAVLKKPGAALGKSTVSSIISGIVYGTAAAVEHLIKSMEKETGFKLKLVLTGGHAKLMSPLIKRKHRVVPHLTFEGLRLIYLKTSH